MPEATPVFEAQRLGDDLNRTGINNKWWVVNQCLSLKNTKNSMSIARADAEKQWLEKFKEISSDNFVGIPWFQDQDASIESKVNCSGGSKSDE